jgi:hypothetical protein
MPLEVYSLEEEILLEVSTLFLFSNSDINFCRFCFVICDLKKKYFLQMDENPSDGTLLLSYNLYQRYILE